MCQPGIHANGTVTAQQYTRQLCQGQSRQHLCVLISTSQSLRLRLLSSRAPGQQYRVIFPTRTLNKLPPVVIPPTLVWPAGILHKHHIRNRWERQLRRCPAIGIQAKVRRCIVQCIAKHLGKQLTPTINSQLVFSNRIRLVIGEMSTPFTNRRAIRAMPETLG